MKGNYSRQKKISNTFIELNIDNMTLVELQMNSLSAKIKTGPEKKHDNYLNETFNIYELDDG